MCWPLTSSHRELATPMPNGTTIAEVAIGRLKRQSSLIRWWSSSHPSKNMKSTTPTSAMTVKVMVESYAWLPACGTAVGQTASRYPAAREALTRKRGSSV